MCCHNKLNEFSDGTSKLFANYGRFVTKYPVWFIIMTVIITALLGINLPQLSSESDLEVLYVPTDSQSVHDRELSGDLFPDKSDSNFYIRSLSRINMYGDIMFKSKDHRDVFSTESIQEIINITSQVRFFSFSDNGAIVKYSDVCAIRNEICHVTGEYLLRNDFLKSYRAGNVTYPYWIDPRGISVNLATSIKGEVDDKGTLQTVSLLLLVFNLRQRINIPRSSLWEKTFVQEISNIDTNVTELVYSTSSSLNDEHNTNTEQDIILVSLSFTILIAYSSFVASSGNCVASRGHLARGGVICVAFAILAAFGFLGAVGLKFVNIVYMMPFLALGVGIDTMFVIMSEWAEHYDEASVEDQMGATLSKCGGSLSITSLTDITAFFIGMTSRFISIRNFCGYTAMALVFSFLFYMTFFLGCLTIHGKRVRAQRHCITCMVVPNTTDNSCSPCNGRSPEKREDDESICEKIPRMFFSSTLFLGIWVKIFVFVLFCVYIGFAVWGITNIKQGLLLGNLVSENSYYYKYEKWKTADFETTMPVSFNFRNIDYLDSDQVSSMNTLLELAEREPTIANGSLLCWYQEYKRRNNFNSSDKVTFMTNLKTFLLTRPHIINDVVFTSDGLSINSSRCHLLTIDLPQSRDQGNFMMRMRELAGSSTLNVFAYSPPFIFFEQYIVVLPNTLQTVGLAVCCITIITSIFMPHPFMIILVTVNMLSILIGIFGFLDFCDLTLSSITMIHLIMSVGFSVDFSVHVCHGYMSSDGDTRNERAIHALRVSAAPVINGGISTLLGIIVLLASQSYIFRSFVKVMVLVITFGLAHAMLLLPVVLSLIGPRKTNKYKVSKHINNK